MILNSIPDTRWPEKFDIRWFQVRGPELRSYSSPKQQQEQRTPRNPDEEDKRFQEAPMFT